MGTCSRHCSVPAGETLSPANPAAEPRACELEGKSWLGNIPVRRSSPCSCSCSHPCAVPSSAGGAGSSLGSHSHPLIHSHSMQFND